MVKIVFEKYGKALVGVLLIVLLIRLLSERINTQEMVVLIKGAGIWGPVVVTLLMASTFIVAPFSAMPFLIAGFLVFGQNILFYHYLAYVLSAIVDFWLARRWGRILVVRLLGEKNMEKVDRFTHKQSLKTLVFLRVLQYQTHDLISYGLGLTEIQFGPYLLATVLGPLPWFFVWSFCIGRQVENLKSFLFWFSLSYLPFWLIFGALIIWWKTNKKNCNP